MTVGNGSWGVGVRRAGVSMDETAIVWLHAQAPAKPPPGAPCNGCGVCCAWQPCPVGVVLSRRRRGACVALRWEEPPGRYRCGVLADAARPRTGTTLPARAWQWLARACIARWIGAGTGCDCDAQVEARPAAHSDP